MLVFGCRTLCYMGSLSACQLCSDAFTELATSLRKFNRKLQTIEYVRQRSCGWPRVAVLMCSLLSSWNCFPTTKPTH